MREQRNKRGTERVGGRKKKSFQGPKDARRRRMFSFFSLLLLFSFLEPSSLGVCWVSDEPGCRPVCPGAVSAMDKLMMRGAHHRQLDIRLRQRDAMLYTIQVRDKRKDLRARRIGTSRGGLERALERICASTSPLVSTNRGNRIGSGCTKSRDAKF